MTNIDAVDLFEEQRRLLSERVELERALLMNMKASFMNKSEKDIFDLFEDHRDYATIEASFFGHMSI